MLSHGSKDLLLALMENFDIDIHSGYLTSWSSKSWWNMLSNDSLPHGMYLDFEPPNKAEFWKTKKAMVVGAGFVENFNNLSLIEKDQYFANEPYIGWLFNKTHHPEFNNYTVWSYNTTQQMPPINESRHGYNWTGMNNYDPLNPSKATGGQKSGYEFKSVESAEKEIKAKTFNTDILKKMTKQGLPYSSSSEESEETPFFRWDKGIRPVDKIIEGQELEYSNSKMHMDIRWNDKQKKENMSWIEAYKKKQQREEHDDEERQRVSDLEDFGPKRAVAGASSIRTLLGIDAFFGKVIGFVGDAADVTENIFNYAVSSERDAKLIGENDPLCLPETCRAFGDWQVGRLQEVEEEQREKQILDMERTKRNKTFNDYYSQRNETIINGKGAIILEHQLISNQYKAYVYDFEKNLFVRYDQSNYTIIESGKNVFSVIDASNLLRLLHGTTGRIMQKFHIHHSMQLCEYKQILNIYNKEVEEQKAAFNEIKKKEKNVPAKEDKTVKKKKNTAAIVCIVLFSVVAVMIIAAVAFFMLMRHREQMKKRVKREYVI